MNEIKNLNPKQVWSIFSEICKVPRPSKKEEKIIAYLLNWAKENKNEDLFLDVLKNKIQRELSVKLKKIYPLSLCEIRVLKVEE